MFASARSWYPGLIGRDPALEPIDNVAEWQITETAWLQLMEDADRFKVVDVIDPDGNDVSFVEDIRPADGA